MYKLTISRFFDLKDLKSTLRYMQGIVYQSCQYWFDYSLFIDKAILEDTSRLVPACTPWSYDCWNNVGSALKHRFNIVSTRYAGCPVGYLISNEYINIKMSIRAGSRTPLPRRSWKQKINQSVCSVPLIIVSVCLNINAYAM